MRGTPSGAATPTPKPGIIPAHAGNTDHDRVSAYRMGDHPRACGEHPSIVHALVKLPGSSPRMRGTLGWLAEEAVRLGIIPAHAGNTSAYDAMYSESRDHPRACGEHKFPDDIARDSWGSSPRMRGTLCAWLRELLSGGIIPAHAGNTGLFPGVE